MDTLAYQNRKIDEIYERIIGAEYARECTVFHLSDHTKILHIGCGAYPLTEIILAQTTDLDIVGIDKDTNAVHHARNLLKKKNLDHRIVITNGNGLDYALTGFDVIIVSSCSSPKIDVLNNIFSRVSPGTSIIVRELGSALDSILNLIKKNPNLELCGRIHHFKLSVFGPIVWNSLHLKKK
ncbi:MAG: class I SAM-dependent methyltransferase [Candidatus Thermoplasmatota archaeon]